MGGILACLLTLVQDHSIVTFQPFLYFLIWWFHFRNFPSPLRLTQGFFPLEEICSLFIPIYKAFLALPTLPSGMITTLLSIQVLQSCHNTAIKASFRVPFMSHFLHESYLLLFLTVCFLHLLKQLLCIMCYARDKINKIWLVLVLKELSLELNCPLDTCGNLNLVKLNTIKNSSSFAVGTFQMLSSHMWSAPTCLEYTFPSLQKVLLYTALKLTATVTINAIIIFTPHFGI